MIIAILLRPLIEVPQFLVQIYPNILYYIISGISVLDFEEIEIEFLQNPFRVLHFLTTDLTNIAEGIGKQRK